MLSKQSFKFEFTAWTVILNIVFWFGFLALVDYFLKLGWLFYVLLGPAVPCLMLLGWAYSLDDWGIDETRAEKFLKRIFKQSKR